MTGGANGYSASFFAKSKWWFYSIRPIIFVSQQLIQTMQCLILLSFCLSVLYYRKSQNRSPLLLLVQLHQTSVSYSRPGLYQYIHTIEKCNHAFCYTNVFEVIIIFVRHAWPIKHAIIVAYTSTCQLQLSLVWYRTCLVVNRGPGKIMNIAV